MINADTIKILPLGGVGHFGKNMMVIESSQDITIVDAGVLFSKNDDGELDLEIPDIQYLRSTQKPISSILITHGHEDHIGAIPFIAKELNVPIFAPPMAMELIKSKLKEHHLLDTVTLNPISLGDKIKLGRITAEPFQMCHSIPDSLGIALHTPAGLVIHTGDFKIDQSPLYGPKADLHKLAQWGQSGVLALLSDSTYATHSGHTESERILTASFESMVGQAKGRIIFATFASSIYRIQQIMDIAEKFGRYVTVLGRKMEQNISISRRLEHLTIHPDTLINRQTARSLPDEKLVIITTGTQGEPTSGLVRLADKRHKQAELSHTDTVIVSSSPIPGNEKESSRTIDNLLRQGVKVFYNEIADVHVHGHGSQEDLKLVINLTKPKYFIPIHGDYRMLSAHQELAVECSVPPLNALIIENGDVLEIGHRSARIIDKIDLEPGLIANRRY